ncbi:MAG: hypothetical protein ACPL3C_08500 [Pyrobaculum sp.]|uniref:hypothetical protein n=1 Tax=Pyrobaculum sp. TaxID=2004705 RepID=UPI003CA6B90D
MRVATMSFHAFEEGPFREIEARANLPPVPALEVFGPPYVKYMMVAGAEVGRLDSEDGSTATETKMRRTASINVVHTFVDAVSYLNIVHEREGGLDAISATLYWHTHYIAL